MRDVSGDSPLLQSRMAMTLARRLVQRDRRRRTLRDNVLYRRHASASDGDREWITRVDRRSADWFHDRPAAPPPPPQLLQLLLLLLEIKRLSTPLVPDELRRRATQRAYTP